MIGISLLTGELVFTALWLLCRGIIWIRQKKIVWKREAALLLMYVNLAVLLRFVLYPFFTVNGQVQPLIINTRSIQPVRINLIPFAKLFDYDSKREAAINILGNVGMFIPTGIILPILYRHIHGFWKAVLAAAGVSFAIEMIPDMDDHIMMTAG